MLRLLVVALLSVAAAAHAADPPSLIVGGPGGLQVVGLDGKARKQLGRTPAAHPRLAPDGKSILFLVPTGSSRLAGPSPQTTYSELRALDLATGTERSITKAFKARLTCAGEGDQTYREVEVSVQEDTDFVIDASGKRACVRLMDLNANRARVLLESTVDLATGKVTRRLGAGSCRLDGKPLTKSPPSASGLGCRRAAPGKPHPGVQGLAAPASIATPAFRYARGAVQKRVGVRWVTTLRLPVLARRGFQEEKRLSGARWAILTGGLNTAEEADYVHHQVFILDRQTGSLYPVMNSPGPWPAPLDARAIAAAKDRLYELTRDVVAEEPEHPLGGDGVFHIARTLVVPGVRVVELPGDVLE